MEAWNLLIQNALIGTDKKPIQPTDLGEDLYPALQLVAENQTLDAEERFLQSLAVTYNYRQVGNEPVRTGELITSELNIANDHDRTLSAVGTNTIAPPETKPYCSPASMELLEQIFDEESLGLLSLWINQCAAKGQLTPPKLVPVFLQLAAKNPDLQPGIQAICGNRGEWLAGLNPDWKKSNPIPLEELWQNGTTVERVAALTQQRRSNPGDARIWLTETWGKETAAVKLKLLETFEIGLSDEDLLLIEQAANDKSLKVKEEANRLLQKIPTAPMVRGFVEYVQSNLQVKKEKTLLGFSSKLQWEIKPAQPVPEEWKKAGIHTVSSDKAFSDDEYIVFQLLERIPPTVLNQLSGLSAAELIELMQKDKKAKWVSPLFASAILFNEQKWINQLALVAEEFVPQLIIRLDQPTVEAYAKKNFAGNEQTFLHVLLSRQNLWSAELTKQVFKYTATHHYSYNRSFYQQHIHLFPVSVAAYLHEADPKEPYLLQTWEKNKELLIKLLELKTRTIQSFN